jgi:hypothetical protein
MFNLSNHTDLRMSMISSIKARATATKISEVDNDISDLRSDLTSNHCSCINTIIETAISKQIKLAHRNSWSKLTR